MAGYSDMIKRGIMENDMALVVKGYNAMFGEKVELPAKRRAEEVDDGGTTGTGVKRPTRGTPVKISGVNLFVDEDGEKRAAAKAVTKVPVKKKKVVKRDEVASTTLKKTKCSSCGETHSVRKDLLMNDSDYTCSDCIISRRR